MQNVSQHRAGQPVDPPANAPESARVEARVGTTDRQVSPTQERAGPLNLLPTADTPPPDSKRPLLDRRVSPARNSRPTPQQFADTAAELIRYLHESQGDSKKDRAWRQLTTYLFENNKQRSLIMFLDGNLPALDALFATDYPIAETVLKALQPSDNNGFIRHYHVDLLDKMQKLYAQGRVKKAVYLSTIGQLLEQIWTHGHTAQGIVLLLPFLEDLVDDPHRGPWATEKLADFYRSLGVVRQWQQQKIYQSPDQNDRKDLGGRSETLLARLREPHTQGKVFVPRQRASYPIEKTTQMPTLSQEQYQQLWSPNSPAHRLRSEYQQSFEQKVLDKGYRDWLFKQGQEGGWRYLLSESWGIEAGCYSAPECLDYTSVASQLDRLREERLRQYTVPQNALILTDDLLTRCFQEFVQSIDTEQFYRALLAEVAGILADPKCKRLLDVQ